MKIENVEYNITMSEHELEIVKSALYNHYSSLSNYSINGHTNREESKKVLEVYLSLAPDVGI